MDQPEYASLLDALKGVPDPRKARGKRYAWNFLFAVVCAALASGQRTPLRLLSGRPYMPPSLCKSWPLPAPPCPVKPRFGDSYGK